MLKKLNLFQKKEWNDEEAVAIQNDDLEEDTEQYEGIEEDHSEAETANLLQIPNHIKNEKEIMDLISAVEQIAHYHHVTKHQYDELKNRFHHTTNQLDEQLKEKDRLMSVVQDKDRMIDTLENNISDKNLKFDQLMEEYNDMKFQLSSQIEELKNMIDVERKKYGAFNQQYEEEVLDWVNKTKKKDEQILKLQSENSNLKEQNEQIRKDNKYLLKTVNDFTSRLSVSFTDYGDRKESSEQSDK